RSARLAERAGNMDVKPHDEHIQRLYARWLDAATNTGLAASLCAFLLYVAGVLPPYVAPERLPELWCPPVGRFLGQTGAPTPRASLSWLFCLLSPEPSPVPGFALRTTTGGSSPSAGST